MVFCSTRGRLPVGGGQAPREHRAARDQPLVQAGPHRSVLHAGTDLLHFVSLFYLDNDNHHKHPIWSIYKDYIIHLADQLSSRAQWTRRATSAAVPHSRSTSGWEVAPPWWSTPSLCWTGLSRCSVTLLAHQCFPFLQICRYVPIKLLSTSNSRVECAMYNTKCTNFTCFVSRKFLFDIMITNPYLHSASLIILIKL